MTKFYIDIEPIEEFIDDDDILSFDATAPLTNCI